MKILFISPSNAIGGAEISLLQMAKFLHQKGHSIFVAMPPTDEKSYENQLRPFVNEFLFVPLMPWNRIQGLSFFHEMKGWAYRIIKSRGGWLNAPFRIVWFIRRHKIEIVHTNTIMSLDGALAAKIAGIPHIQHLREITGFREDALFTMLGQSRVKTFGRLWGSLHAAMIANSYYTKKAYDDFVSTEKIRMVYNCVEASDVVTVSHPITTMNTVGLIANVTSKVKNHRLFIQIVGKLGQIMPNLDFMVFGKLPPEHDAYLQTLRQEIAQQKLSKNLIFKGLCGETTQMYAQIGVLLHTYPYESFGRIFIEAMAHGVPVVAVRGGGADELIEDGKTGYLFEINEIETAAKRVHALCEDAELYTRISENGRQFAKRFQSEVTGAQLLEIYQEVLN